MHCRWIDAKPLGNDRYARPPRSCQSLTDLLLQRRGYWRPTKTLPLAPGPRKPGADAFLNHGTLELGKYAHHLKHRLACRRRGVEPLLMQEQVDVEGMQLDRKATSSDYSPAPCGANAAWRHSIPPSTMHAPLRQEGYRERHDQQDSHASKR